MTGVCPTCGAENLSDAEFCATCGIALPDDPTVPRGLAALVEADAPVTPPRAAESASPPAAEPTVAEPARRRTPGPSSTPNITSDPVQPQRAVVTNQTPPPSSPPRPPRPWLAPTIAVFVILLLAAGALVAVSLDGDGDAGSADSSPAATSVISAPAASQLGASDTDLGDSDDTEDPAPTATT
ncbi:MAG: zinc ribbon domain-containing protein, partial [Actinomycetota bacterium]